ncbi:MAG TPA: TIGR01777 family oxidoreductase [Gemmatimonadaceae bacterium]|nr:TIGR01777 family oxidoreductase [Gemmatimonadaceae bacterium]
MNESPETESRAHSPTATAVGLAERRRIAVTGATGFIGRALLRHLRQAGHEVRRIGRSGDADVRWNPAAGTMDAAGLDGVDAVIHLAGEQIAQRWTAEARQRILDSRVDGTRLIAQTCAAMRVTPEVLVCSSAVGIYGDRGDLWLDESSETGSDFLADVCRRWEAAAQPARDVGMRVVHLRTGVALSPEGGALGKMLLPFQMGVGGRLGAGTQWMSWISRHDLVRAMLFAVESPELSGPVNAVAPEPVTNATFASTLGRVLRRPAVLPVPRFALRAMYGRMAEETILASQRVRARALEAAGFAFTHPTLASALRFELAEAQQ